MGRRVIASWAPEPGGLLERILVRKIVPSLDVPTGYRLDVVSGRRPSTVVAWSSLVQVDIQPLASISRHLLSGKMAASDATDKQ